MAKPKVARMVLKVDLSCPDCFKNVKKILGKFPEIRDQVYDKNKNQVKITAVCCCPEKIRDRLCEKGRKVIKSIEIIEAAASSKASKQTDDQPKTTTAPPLPEITAAPPPPKTTAALGVPVPENYYPFLLWLCPMCSGGGCPWCYGCGKFVPQPPPPAQFHNYFGYASQ